MFVSLACMSVHHMCTKKDTKPPGRAVTDVCERWIM